MSLVTHDLKCPAGHVEIDALYKRGEIPPCPIDGCGRDRTVFYATREMEGRAALDHAAAQVGTFRPITFGGETYHDRGSYDRAVDTWCKKQNLTRDQVAIEPMASAAQRSAHRDELRHEAWEIRKRDGFDDRKFKDYQKNEAERVRARR